MNKSLLALSVLLLAVAVSSSSASPTLRPVPNGCPALPNDVFGLCVDKCAGGCPPRWICCPNGCGQYCYNPVTGENNA